MAASTAPSARLPLARFDYPLPADRIAQVPAEPRDSSRLLHVGTAGTCSDHRFRDLPDLLRPGDLLVVNDTRVRAARLRGRRSDGGDAEVLLLQHLGGDRFEALVRPGRRLRAGATVFVGDDLRLTILGAAAGHPGARVVAVEPQRNEAVDEAVEAAGEVPLPPYITTPLHDRSRYQTVYAAGDPASAAAPTAGLHFTEAVRTALAERGIGWAAVRLTVGLGTFAPIASADAAEHAMHTEECTVPPSTVAALEATRRAGGRVVAVGTTVVRTLESHRDATGTVVAGTRVTDLFITPGYRVVTVDGLLTNFHQPRSSLLVMLEAMIGAGRWRQAYDHALEHGYRFLSFGDCMLCWTQTGPG